MNAISESGSAEAMASHQPDLAEESRLYQITMEYTRTALERGTSEDEDTELVDAIADAGKAVEVAWLNHATLTA